MLAPPLKHFLSFSPPFFCLPSSLAHILPPLLSSRGSPTANPSGCSAAFLLGFSGSGFVRETPVSLALPPCFNGRLEPCSSIKSTDTQSHCAALQAGTGVRWSSKGRYSTSLRKSGREEQRYGWVGVGVGGYHKLNISCLMYHLLIQFVTGEKTGMMKRTHRPSHLRFHSEPCDVQRMTFIKTTGFIAVHTCTVSAPCTQTQRTFVSGNSCGL